MEKVYIGKIVSTHGIKGEIKILSDFPYKNKVFMVGNTLIVDDKNYCIRSYRVHKKFDMVTFEGYNDINEVLCLLKKDVYFLKSNLDLDEDEVLDSELMEFRVISSDGREGVIKEIFMASPYNKILRVEFDYEVLIPLYSPFVLKIDKKNKSILVELIDGM